MADEAKLNFLDGDWQPVCQMALFAQGGFALPSGLSALELVDAATARDAGEAEVQLLEGLRYEYALSEGWELGLAHQYSDAQGIVLQSKLATRGHCGVLNPGLATGQLPLVAHKVGSEVFAIASVEVRSRKLDYKDDYQQMMSEIGAKCVELLQDMRAPSLMNAMPEPGEDSRTIGQQFAFVRALLRSQEFDNALHRIASRPHQIWQREEREQPISHGFRPTGKLIRQMATGSRRVALSATHPLRVAVPGLSSLPEKVTVNRSILTTDTPENRFVKFALRSFKQFLAAMHESPRLDAAKDARLLADISALVIRLDEALSSDVLRHASEPTFLPLGSPTLQRREGYREVFQAWVHFAMAARLAWEGGDTVYGAGQRDVATLYEYWVFFALLEVVGKVFALNPKDKEALIEPTGDGFGLKLKAGKHIALKGQSIQPGRVLEVRFSYNRSFRATNKPRVPGSWSQPMRPDYTLSLWPKGFTETEAEQQELMVHVHFDAKYRLDQVAELFASTAAVENLSDEAVDEQLDAEKRDESRGTYKRADLLKMHAYRDAIRRSQGAYVIYPGDNGASTRRQGFHEVLPGLGAFAMRPGAGTSVLEEFLRDVVNHVADRSTAREQQSFHTYKTYESSRPPAAEEDRSRYSVFPEKLPDSTIRHTPPSETFVVVGWLKSNQHLQWIRSAGKYNFRMDNTPGALRLSPQIAGATFLLLHGANGNAEPGLFRIKQPELGPQVLTATELIFMGYPSTPSQTSYLVYDLEPDQEFEGYRWNYAALQNKPATAELGYPFATSLQEMLKVGVPL